MRFLYIISPPAVTKYCADLISKLLEKDPAKRSSLDEILEHPWIKLKPYTKQELNLNQKNGISKSDTVLFFPIN